MARFMWGWVLLGFGVPATTFLLPLFLGSLEWESLIPLFGAIVSTALGAWMVSSGAGRWRGDWSASERGRMTRFVWGGVLVVLGVPALVYSLPQVVGFVALAPARALEVAPPFFRVSLFSAILAGVGTWMLWSGARRRASAVYRMPRRKWAAALVPGLMTSVAVAATWLCASLYWFVLVFSAEGTAAEEDRLMYLLLGSLFAAPLVGAIIILVEWLRHRRALPPAGRSAAGVQARRG